MTFFQVNVQSPIQMTPPLQEAAEKKLFFYLSHSVLAETFLQAGPVVKSVLLLLILLSIVCWGIILYKYVMLRRANKHAQAFLGLFSKASSLMELYHASKNISTSPILEVFDAGYMELTRLLPTKGNSDPESSDTLDNTATANAAASLKAGGMKNVNRAMQKAKSRVSTDMERYLTFLATTGSTAPFIGLFGTVWGIMTAFRSIGTTGSANLATVAPGIAEALIATAVGLFAAIPAVVAYNLFLNRVRVLTNDMENFSSELLNLIERHLLKVL